MFTRSTRRPDSGFGLADIVDDRLFDPGRRIPEYILADATFGTWCQSLPFGFRLARAARHRPVPPNP
jgi:hypothetical protein